MFGTVAITNMSLEEYAPIVGAEKIAQLRELAAPLRGLRFLHLTSPAASGAVRYLLSSSIPLFIDLGLQTLWQQVRMPTDMWQMDQRQRRALSGYTVEWTRQDEAEWRRFNEANAELYDEEFDVVVVHHTGSVGLLPALTRRRIRGQPSVRPQASLTQRSMTTRTSSGPTHLVTGRRLFSRVSTPWRRAQAR